MYFLLQVFHSACYLENVPSREIQKLRKGLASLSRKSCRYFYSSYANRVRDASSLSCYPIWIAMYRARSGSLVRVSSVAMSRKHQYRISRLFQTELEMFSRESRECLMLEILDIWSALPSSHTQVSKILVSYTFILFLVIFHVERIRESVSLKLI